MNEIKQIIEQIEEERIERAQAKLNEIIANLEDAK